MLGIDLGAYSAKFCLTRRKKETFELLWLGEMRLPSYSIVGGEIKDKNSLADNLQQFLRRNHLPREVVVSFYHPRMVVQNISLPEMPDEELENALRWEASSIITGEDSFQVGWQTIEKKEGQQKILFAASPSWIVEEYLDVFHRARLEVEALEPQVLSLIRGFLSLYPDLVDSTFSVVDLGFTKGGILYFSAGELVFSRYFNWGLGKVGNYLEEKFRLLPIEIIELFNRSTKEDIPYQMEEALAEVSKDLVMELRRSLTFLHSEFDSSSDQKLFLSGGGAEIPFLRQILIENLPLSVGRIPPLMVEGEEFSGSVYMGALGASLWS